MHQLPLPLSNTRTFLYEIIFPILFKCFVTKNPYKNENEIVLIFKYIWYHYEMQNAISFFFLWRV